MFSCVPQIGRAPLESGWSWKLRAGIAFLWESSELGRGPGLDLLDPVVSFKPRHHTQPAAV